MKRLLFKIAVLFIVFVTIQGLSSSVSAQETTKSNTSHLEKAFVEISQLPNFQFLPEEDLVERYGKEMGTIKCTIYGNADPRDAVLKILNNIPKDYLYKEEISEDNYISRFYIEPYKGSKAQMLMAFVGNGGNDLMVVLFSGASPEVYKNKIGK